jgi:hypothetical protein
MRNIKYRIISAMFTIQGEKFRVEYMDMDADVTRPWRHLQDDEWVEWYDNIKDAKKAIKWHKRVANYVPKTIYVD